LLFPWRNALYWCHLDGILIRTNPTITIEKPRILVKDITLKPDFEKIAIAIAQTINMSTS
jgi:hypothetical protein